MNDIIGAWGVALSCKSFSPVEYNNLRFFVKLSLEDFYNKFMSFLFVFGNAPPPTLTPYWVSLSFNPTHNCRVIILLIVSIRIFRFGGLSGWFS